MAWNPLFQNFNSDGLSNLMSNTRSYLFGSTPNIDPNFIESNMYNTGSSPGIQLGTNYQPPTDMYSPSLLGSNFNLNSNMDTGLVGRIGDGFNKLGDWASKNQALLNFGGALIDGVGGYVTNSRTMDLMKRSITNSENQWNKQYDMQRQMTNNQLSDRQRRRVSANPNAESVDSYMKKWGV